MHRERPAAYLIVLSNRSFIDDEIGEFDYLMDLSIGARSVRLNSRLGCCILDSSGGRLRGPSPLSCISLVHREVLLAGRA